MLTAKQQEVACLQAFVQSLPPDSYLHDYMQGAVEQFASMIAVDHCFPRTGLMAELLRDLAGTQKTLGTVTKHVENMRTVRDELVQQINKAAQRAAEIQRQAQACRDWAGNAIDKANDALSALS